MPTATAPPGNLYGHTSGGFKHFTLMVIFNFINEKDAGRREGQIEK